MNTKESLKNLFAQHVVNITFKKINNEERKMICTLKPDLLPVQEKKEQTKKKPENDNILPVWDLEQKAFRSFRVDSLINYSVVED